MLTFSLKCVKIVNKLNFIREKINSKTEQIKLNVNASWSKMCVYKKLYQIVHLLIGGGFCEQSPF